MAQELGVEPSPSIIGIGLGELHVDAAKVDADALPQALEKAIERARTLAEQRARDKRAQVDAEAKLVERINTLVAEDGDAESG